MIAEKIPELQKLSLKEKLILAGELWNELAAHPNAFPTREDHIELLQERLDHYRKHPEDTVAWEEVKKRILASLSLRVEFLSGADADLQEIFNRFEDYREAFGTEFMVTVDAYLTRISVFPQIAPVYFQNIRRQDERQIIRRLQS